MGALTSSINTSWHAVARRHGLSLVTKADGEQLAGATPVAAAGARVVARKEPRGSASWCMWQPRGEVWGSEEGAMSATANAAG